MKKLFTILVMIVSVLAATNAMSQNQPASEKLELNNGAKWKVDNTTNSNVKNLKVIGNAFAGQTDRSLKAYHKTANNLQDGLNKMIRECKMKGPDHLALHKWLEPLMAQVEKLKETATFAAADHSFQAIALQLNCFDKYFEQ